MKFFKMLLLITGLLTQPFLMQGDIGDLSDLIEQANDKQAEFQETIDKAPFQNENLKTQFNKWMTTIKEQMKINKNALEEKGKKHAEEQISQLQEASQDQKSVIHMQHKIKWLTKYYEIINDKLIPLEQKTLENLQEMDKAIESKSFLNKFDNIFAKQIEEATEKTEDEEITEQEKEPTEKIEDITQDAESEEITEEEEEEEENIGENETEITEIEESTGKDTIAPAIAKQIEEKIKKPKA